MTQIKWTSGLKINRLQISNSLAVDEENAVNEKFMEKCIEHSTGLRDNAKCHGTRHSSWH